MPRPSAQLLHAWLLTWWRHFDEDSELAVQVAYRGDELIGALPLCVRHRRGLDVLTFLGAEHVTLADLLLAEGEQDGIGAELAARAMATKHDYADFHGLPGSSRLTKALGSSPLELIVRAEAPVLELDGVDWETYYKTRLSSNQRALHRRRMRQLGRLGNLGDDRRADARRARSGPRGRVRAACAALARPAGPLRFRNRGGQAVPPGGHGAAGRARRAADRDAQARRAADRLRLLLRARDDDVLPPARLRPRPPAPVPRAREPVRHPGQRLRRRRDASRVLRRHGALQDGAHRPDGAAPRGARARAQPRRQGRRLRTAELGAPPTVRQALADDSPLLLRRARAGAAAPPSGSGS